MMKQAIYILFLSMSSCVGALASEKSHPWGTETSISVSKFSTTVAGTHTEGSVRKNAYPTLCEAIDAAKAAAEETAFLGGETIFSNIGQRGYPFMIAARKGSLVATYSIEVGNYASGSYVVAAWWTGCGGLLDWGKEKVKIPLTPGTRNEGSVASFDLDFPPGCDLVDPYYCGVHRTPAVSVFEITNANFTLDDVLENWSPEKPIQEVNDPINVVKGNVTHSEQDWLLPGGLDFRRTYDSRQQQAREPLGAQWSHSYHVHVQEKETAVNGDTNRWVYFYQGNADTAVFQYDVATDQYLKPYGQDLVLTTNAAGQYFIYDPPDAYYEFASGGEISRMTNVYGQGLYFDYQNNLLRQVSNGFGERLSFAYNTDERLSKVYSVDTNLTIQFSYTADGALAKADLNLGDRTYTKRYSYGPRGTNAYHSLTQYVNAAGSTSVWEYAADENGNLTGIGVAGHVGGEGYFLVDISNNQTTARSSVTYQRGTEQDNYVYEYHPFTYEVEAILGPESTVSFRQGEFYEYDDNGNTIEIMRKGDGASITGQVYKTILQYDANHNPTNIRYGFNQDPNTLPHKWTYTYDSPNRRITSATDPEGSKIEYAYDQGRLQAVRSYLSSNEYASSTFRYNEQGLLLSVTNENGIGTGYAYTPSGHLETVTPARGPQILFTHREDGYVTQRILPGPDGDRVTAYERDLLGRVTKMTYPDSSSEHFEYDSYDNLTRFMDRAGRTSEFDYVIGIKAASQTRYLIQDNTSEVVSIQNEYDQQMNSLNIRDPLGRVVESYQLDRLGRAVTVTNVEGQTMEVNYGLEDWVKSIQRFDGSELLFSYNSQGLLSFVDYPDDTLRFEYASDGMMQSASNHLGLIISDYDARKRLTRQSQLGPVAWVDYSYYPAGQISNRITAAGIVEYKLDAGDRLSEIKAGDDLFSYEYNVYNGRVDSLYYPNGLIQRTEYDVMDRPVAIVYEQINEGATVEVKRIDYQYNAVGMITNRIDDGIPTAYTYDSLDRLTSESGPQAHASYTYDLAGNRLSKDRPGMDVAYHHGPGNRLTNWNVHVEGGGQYPLSIHGSSSESIPSEGLYSTREIGPYNARVQGSNFWYIGYVMTNSTDELVARISDAAGNVGSATQTVSLSVVSNAVYAYDLAGKLTNIQYNGEEYLSLQWNEQYQLTAVRANAAGGETGEHIVETYDYDALGRRVKITEGTNVTWLIYDGIHVIAETDDQGNLKKSYVHGPGVDNLLSMTVYNSETNTYTYLKDHLNSTVALADESGHIVETYTYDAWGRVSVFDGAGMPLTESAIGNRYTFQGRACSWTTGLYYFRARYYDPISGRWLSKDPIGISGGLNQYVFCKDNPVYFVDPNGENATVLLIIAGAAAFGYGMWELGQWYNEMYEGLYPDDRPEIDDFDSALERQQDLDNKLDELQDYAREGGLKGTAMLSPIPIPVPKPNNYQNDGVGCE